MRKLLIIISLMAFNVSAITAEKFNTLEPLYKVTYVKGVIDALDGGHLRVYGVCEKAKPDINYIAVTVNNFASFSEASNKEVRDLYVAIMMKDHPCKNH